MKYKRFEELPVWKDAAKMAAGNQTPIEIREGILSYIQDQRFNCFISLNIPIAEADNPIGVVNIHSNHTLILDLDDGDQSELAILLNPYCAILGLILRRS